MTLDIEGAKFAMLIFSTIVMPIGSIAYTWIATRDKDNTQHIKAVEKTLTEAVARITSRQDQMEANLKHLPSANELSTLKADMREVQANQEALLRESAATRSAVSRIEDFLLRK